MLENKMVLPNADPEYEEYKPDVECDDCGARFERRERLYYRFSSGYENCCPECGGTELSDYEPSELYSVMLDIAATQGKKL